ncbi:unnamed protein product [Discosporangium mesarthrocarpum]
MKDQSSRAADGCAVRVHFKPIANAPILRKTKFLVPSSWTCFELHTSLRNQLQLPEGTPLFLYCNNAFEPCVDQSLSNLYQVSAHCPHFSKQTHLRQDENFDE